MEDRNQDFLTKTNNFKHFLSTPLICVRCSKLISSPAGDFQLETSLLTSVFSSCLNCLYAFFSPSKFTSLISSPEGVHSFFKAFIPYLEAVMFLDNMHPSHLSGHPGHAKKRYFWLEMR